MTALRAVVATTLGQLLDGGRLRLAAAFALGPTLLVVAARHADPGADAGAALDAGIRWAFFGFVAFALPFVFGAGVFAEEIERRTIVYTLTRPIPRATLALGRLGAVWIASAGALLAGLALLHLGLFAVEPAALLEHAPATLRGAAALLLLLVYYAALATFWSAAVPDAAATLVALWFAVVELLFGMAPGVLRWISAGYLAGELAGLERVGLMADRTPDLPAAVLVAALVGLGAVATGATVAVVRLSELRVGEA